MPKRSHTTPCNRRILSVTLAPSPLPASAQQCPCHPHTRGSAHQRPPSLFHVIALPTPRSTLHAADAPTMRRRDCPTTDTPGIRHPSRAAVNGPPPRLPHHRHARPTPSVACRGEWAAEMQSAKSAASRQRVRGTKSAEECTARASGPMRRRVHNISQGRGRRRARAAQTSQPPLVTCHQCRYKRARPLAPRRTSRPRIDHAVNGYHACAPAAPVPPSVQTKRSSNRGEARTTHAMDSTPGGRPEATGRDTTDATMRNVGVHDNIIPRATHSTHALDPRDKSFHAETT